MPIDGQVVHPPAFARRWRERGYWIDRSLADVYFEHFARHAPRTVVVDGDRDLTYAELADRAETIAANLYGMGLRPRDRVVVQLPPVLEFVEVYFALQRIGAIPIAALPAHRHREIDHFVAVSDAAAVIAPTIHRDFDHAAMIADIRSARPTLQHVVLVGPPAEVPRDATALTTLREQEPEVAWRTAVAELELDPDDPAVLQLSGGTTGVPKLIPRTHNDYVYNTEVAVSVCDIRPDDVLLLVLPVAHNLPLACPGLQGFLRSGAKVVLSASARPDVVADLIERHRVTHIHVVPALLIGWVNAPDVERHDLSSVRVIQSGGQRLQPETRARTEVVFPNCTVQENFGMAEGLLMFVRLDDPADVRRETCGRPVCPDDEVRLVDEDGADVAPGEVGEMLCRGPYTLRGYYRAEEHNQRAFTEDGFYRSGDLMRQHPSGNFVVEGRRKDLINRGGEKISAEEVENLILAHDDVINVACVPVPDDRLGERMCACVVLRDDASLTLDELCTFLLGFGIAKFKLPERLETFRQLPVSNVGKVAKKELVEHLSGR